MNKRTAEDLLVSPGTVDLCESKKMDTKASPLKVGYDQAEDDAVVARIKDTAPEWFSEAFTFIINTIKEQGSSTKTAHKQLEGKVEVLEKRIRCLRPDHARCIQKQRLEKEGAEGLGQKNQSRNPWLPRALSGHQFKADRSSGQARLRL